MLTSKVTERLQTTIPAGVRNALGIEPGERIGYVIEGNEVRIVNASALEEADPIVDSFLSFLAQDMSNNPARLTAIPESLIKRARKLTAGIEIDHDDAISGVTAF